MSTTLAREMSSGRVALLERSAQSVRAQALGIGRAPVDAADAEMGRKREAAAAVERVLIRARLVWSIHGLTRRQVVRYDVLTVRGRSTELYAGDCVFWEEAVALASDALKGRVTVSLGGARTTFAGPGLSAPASDIAQAKGLAGDAGAGWRKPAPGEVVVVQGRKP